MHCVVALTWHACWGKRSCGWGGGGGLECVIDAAWGRRTWASIRVCSISRGPNTPVHLPLPAPLAPSLPPRYLKFISLGGFKHVLSVLQNWGSTFVVEAPEATPPLRMSRSLSNASEASADLTEGQ